MLLPVVRGGESRLAVAVAPPTSQRPQGANALRSDLVGSIELLGGNWLVHSSVNNKLMKNIEKYMFLLNYHRKTSVCQIQRDEAECGETTNVFERKRRQMQPTTLLKQARKYHNT